MLRISLEVVVLGQHLRMMFLLPFTVLLSPFVICAVCARTETVLLLVNLQWKFLRQIFLLKTKMFFFHHFPNTYSIYLFIFLAFVLQSSKTVQL